MASNSNNTTIIENWLRSVKLVQYTQAFIDNGYDDLEVCKQIGEADLDAIGVARDQREKLLRAVKILREEGGAAVYFTLEECDTCQSGDETEGGECNEDEPCHGSGVIVASSVKTREAICPDGATFKLDAYDMGKTTLVTFPKVQLKLILRDKLVEDSIDLSGPPYTNPDNMVVCGSSLTALAMRFAEELKTHFIDVLERLEELWLIARNNDFCPTMCRSPSRSVYSEEHTAHYGYPPLHHHYHPHHFHYPSSPRSQPPPLPSCPPPATISSANIDKCASLKVHLEGNQNRSDPLAHQNYQALDGGVCCILPRKIIKDTSVTPEDKKKGGSVIGRFFRNIGFRKSNRKGSYKQHQGDLNAYEISMSEEDRMALMILVKEGKISTQTALAVVQRFEEEKKVASKTDDGKENICDTPTKKGSGKKKKGVKPTKSQSSLSADDPQRCQPGSQGNLCVEPGQSCDHQMCRQKRVHSLGQLDVSQFRSHLEHLQGRHHDRMYGTQVLPSSHNGTPSRKLSSQVEPADVARLHSPSHQLLPHQSQLQPAQYHYHHHRHHSISKMDVLQERLSGKSSNTVPKTTSKTSLLSSGSDQSMECGSQTQLRTDPMSQQGGDRTAYNSNSTVSMNSDTNSPAAGRKKSLGVQDPRLKNHRSASCSTGDDGISSENDDIENGSRRQLQADQGKGRMTADINKLSRVKEATISRPPLLRQRSAPGGSPIFSGAYLGQAKVIVDYIPAPDEEDFVPLKKGEIVNIINMAQSGVWRGMVGGKRGKFHFEHVEVVTEPDKATCGKIFAGHKDVPKSVGDLLQKIGLEPLTPVFMQNGYDDLDIFSELDEHDLDTLHITDAVYRTKLLSAARVLADWHEKGNVHTSALTNMDSPSSRAGNSSCDSGCYTGGESKHRSRSRGSGSLREGGKKMENTVGHHQNSVNHTPCRSCGKPKQPRKYCGPLVVTHYTPGQYPSHTQLHNTPSHLLHNSGLSPYTAGHLQYADPLQYAQAHYGYHYSPTHSQDYAQYTMSVSRTLTELNVADNHTSPVHSETFIGRRQGSKSTSPVCTDKLTADSGHTARNDKGSTGDRVSLTEEDQEVIAITYGTNQTRKLASPIQSVSSGSSQLEITNTLMCSACVPSSGCPQCDENVLCDNSSCHQCAAYISCPQCFPYKHYVNTTLRSESKSSKMSCSSTCTQTTCLSPDHDDSSHSGGSNRNDYTASNHGPYYASKSSPAKGQQYQCCQQQCMPYPFYRRTPTIPETPTTPKQLPSPSVGPTPSVQNHPLTLALTDSKAPQGLALTLKTEGSSSLASNIDWGSHADDTDAPGMATLYSRGRSQTPEKGETTQMKSPTRSLMPLVSTKLSAERIDLTKLPYSTVIGHCGIPPLLVQRYSEELRQDVATMSLVLEQLREKQLRELGRPCILNESLSESCKNACDLQISTVQNFLTSVGLPMYQKSLGDGGINTLEQLLKLKESELEQMTGADSRHLRRIAHALEWVQHKLASPSHKTRVAGVTDKV